MTRTDLLNKKVDKLNNTSEALELRGLVLLCIYEDVLYIYRANIDNSYGERLAKIYIPNMKNIQGKAGLFGGKFSFKYEGQEYKFKLPSKAGKFVDFFVK